MGELKGTWAGVTVVRKYESHQGGVKGIRNMCQLMERSNGHVGSVKEMWRGVAAVSILRVMCNIFSTSLYLSLLQVFTRKSKNLCRIKNIQEYPRLCKHLGFF